GALAATFGAIGYALARSGVVWLLEPLASRVPADRHAAFLADGWAHGASYGFGFLGAMVACVSVVVRRHRKAWVASKRDGQSARWHSRCGSEHSARPTCSPSGPGFLDVHWHQNSVMPAWYSGSDSNASP